VWGRACNLASRMESTGEDGRIQVSYKVAEKAKNNPDFRFVERGSVFCKGIGDVHTFFVEDTRR
jgi:adenylate cyclase